jgi:heme exporter protein CcmD
MAKFFAMGGYAIFVWPAYTASVLVLGVAIVLSLNAHARARKIVRQLEEESGETGDSDT